MCAYIDQLLQSKGRTRVKQMQEIDRNRDRVCDHWESTVVNVQRRLHKMYV